MARKHLNLGSVSCATMRPEDLIPTFVYELRNQRPCKRAHRALLREIESRMESDSYFSSEDSEFDLEALFDALNEYCAPYFVFGSHPGDGADFGYWLGEGFADDFDGLKVSDLSEVPADHVGEVLLVSDHGNISLYSRGRNHRLYEVWSIV